MNDPHIVDQNQIPEYEAPSPYTRFARALVDPALIKDAPMSIGLFRYKPGQIGPAHKHDTETEVYYVLEGRGTVSLDGQTVELRKGVVVYIRPGVEHETKNTGDDEMMFLGIFAPALDFTAIKKQWKSV